VKSFVPSGCGANVLHNILQQEMLGYSVVDYNPWLTLFPPFLYTVGRNLQPGLIHCPLDYAFFFKKKDVPLVATVHGYVLDQAMRTYSSKIKNIHYQTDLRWIVKASLLKTDRLTAVSHFLADMLRSDLGVTKNIDVIYNGIDERAFIPKIRTTKNKYFRILYSGNLSKLKQAYLIRPLAESLGAGFEVVYTSGLAKDAPASSERLSSGALLTSIGRIPYANMPEVYQSVDALFMPSVREGFGLSIIEAMACGLPIVANNCSAIPEIVTHDMGGYLCEVGNMGQYSQAFRELADSARAAKVMGEFNRCEVEVKFTMAQMVKKYGQLFEETMSCKNDYI
jgi:glycosyltransferase involved in cell wall biosynthesis